MFNSIFEYQKEVYERMYNMFSFKNGIFTCSTDSEYLNANCLIVNKMTQNLSNDITSIIIENPTIKRIQIPLSANTFEANECLYLLKIDELEHKNLDVSIIEVKQNTYEQYVRVSNSLQFQEYGKLYKENWDKAILKRKKCKQYLIKYKNEFVGEFVFLPDICAIESLIVLKQYQNNKIGSSALSLLIKQQKKSIYLSADNSSIDFYKQINAHILIVQDVKYIYGNSDNLLMQVSMAL